MDHPDDLPTPPLNDIVEDQETYIVNGCSGHVTWHDPKECKGDCQSIELDHMAVKIRNEHIMWARAGMSTDMITHDVWNMDVQMLSVLEILEGIVGIEKMNEVYRQKLLAKLHDYREKAEPEFRKQRKKAELSIAQKRILGPNGEVLQ